jgi:biotin transporter BioY
VAEQQRNESSNDSLTALWVIGSLLILIGGIMWLANLSEPTGYGEERNLVAFAVGGSMVGAGVSFIALALVVTAICHQIRESAKR